MKLTKNSKGNKMKRDSLNNIKMNSIIWMKKQNRS